MITNTFLLCHIYDGNGALRQGGVSCCVGAVRSPALPHKLVPNVLVNAVSRIAEETDISRTAGESTRWP